jgi:hypothetical protein
MRATVHECGVRASVRVGRMRKEVPLGASYEGRHEEETMLRSSQAQEKLGNDEASSLFPLT